MRIIELICLSLPVSMAVIRHRLTMFFTCQSIRPSSQACAAVLPRLFHKHLLNCWPDFNPSSKPETLSARYPPLQSLADFCFWRRVNELEGCTCKREYGPAHPKLVYLSLHNSLQRCQ